MPSIFNIRAKTRKRPSLEREKSPSKDSRQIARTPDTKPELTADSTNLWAQAEQILRADPKTREILDEATRILEGFGLKIGSEHQQLCSFLDDRVTKIEEKKRMIHYREVSGQDLLTTIFQNVLKVKDIVNTAASASTPAAIACAGVTVCLVLFIQGVEQHKALLKGLDTTAALIPRLCIMENLYLHSQSSAKLTDEFTERFKERFMIMLGKILEFQARALCCLRRESFTRFYRGMLKQDHWDALLQDMTSLESESEKFTTLINAAENKAEREKLEHELENALQSYKTWQTSSNRDERVKKFPRELYKHTCPYQERKDRNNKHVPETCEWFTQHERFKNWDQSHESCLLWVSADPGCGKSVLAKYLVDEFLPRPRKRTVCYFFFKDDIQTRKAQQAHSVR
ncbi:hypothetical protein N7520_001891 [Penicillium odoratum]|uniref:uncharacterized protein n=1 Tax=Penicillium odoratum TaxID=1167516 RepID=UPI0025488B17|nr:uncharacterized protein N7520_001891 [Penicillium odoratum]KAJ5778645.1 hypothetical protein N7520_001891 [Penicillium odoratum]